MLRVYGCIADQHNVWLVALAGAICLFASFTAFSLFARTTVSEGSRRYAWLAAGALVTGCGVWVTHFVGMIAFRPGLPVRYDIGLTMLSVVAAICMSGAGFFVSLTRNRTSLGGAIIGLAIGAMHFIGMRAMNLPAQKHWDPYYVTASVLIGVIFGTAALRLHQQMANLRGRLFSTALLTFGICGMHFVAMAALSFTPDPLIQVPETTTESAWLSFAVVVVALLIVSVGLICSIIDQSLATRAAAESKRLRHHVAELQASAHALLESESRIRNIAHTLPGFLFQCVVAADESIRFKVICSDKFEFDASLTGNLKNGDELSLNIAKDTDRPHLKSCVLAASQSGLRWEHTFRVATSDGSFRWVRATAEATERAGNDRIWNGIALDETDRINAEKENTQLQAQLRQTEKMESIGTLAGGMAHELNNLLQPILMMTELVMSDLPEPSTQHTRLMKVVDAGTKASEIVQRILAFGRVDERSLEPIDISSAFHDAIALIRAVLPSSITLHVAIDECVGTIRGDITQLTQVLINLATNARDAIGANVGTVWVSLSRSRNDIERAASERGQPLHGSYAVLTVRDTGLGMDQATMQRVFEPFFTTKGVGQGTGLGLSVTHGIVAGHGGTIEVDSTPGEGTSFSIYLPIEEKSATLALAS